MVSLSLKRKFLALLFALGLALLPLAGYALKVGDVPNPRQMNGGWVTDMANILSDSTEAQLDRAISELEARNGAEIAVVTVPETTPASSPKAFATELFNTWGIGKKGQDNGILFLTSVGDRRVEIETGYGIEALLPDAKVGKIIQTEIVPRFKQQDFEGGIVAGTQALIGAIDNPATSDDSNYIAPQSGILVPIIVFFLSVSSSTYFPFLVSLLFFLIAIFCFFIAYRQDLESIYTIAQIGVSIYLIAVAMIVLFLAVTENINSYGDISALISKTIKPLGIVSLIIAWFLADFLLKMKQRVFCKTCNKPMEKLSEEKLIPLLTAPQKKALELKSVEYKAWQCPRCSKTPDSFIAILNESR